MSEKERTGTRDLTYSQWHRTGSLSRFVGRRPAYECSVIDIDWAEYCRICKRVLALIETQCSTSAPKSADVTANLARQANVRAYSVSYWKNGADIAGFRWRCISPELGPIVTGTPDQYASFLVSLRMFHECGAPDLTSADELEVRS